MSQILYGQKGYSGISMSNRAIDAYDNNEMPISKWNKKEILLRINEIAEDNYFIIPINLDSLTKTELTQKFLYKSSWHHTGKFANITDFYSVDEDKVLEFINNLLQDKDLYLESLYIINKICKEIRDERNLIKSYIYEREDVEWWKLKHIENIPEKYKNLMNSREQDNTFDTWKFELLLREYSVTNKNNTFKCFVYNKKSKTLEIDYDYISNMENTLEEYIKKSLISDEYKYLDFELMNLHENNYEYDLIDEYSEISEYVKDFKMNLVEFTKKVYPSCKNIEDIINKCLSNCNIDIDEIVYDVTQKLEEDVEQFIEDFWSDCHDVLSKAKYQQEDFYILKSIFLNNFIPNEYHISTLDDEHTVMPYYKFNDFGFHGSPYIDKEKYNELQQNNCIALDDLIDAKINKNKLNYDLTLKNAYSNINYFIKNKDTDIIQDNIKSLERELEFNEINNCKSNIQRAKATIKDYQNKKHKQQNYEI